MKIVRGNRFTDYIHFVICEICVICLIRGSGCQRNSEPYIHTDFTDYTDLYACLICEIRVICLISGSGCG